MKVVNRLKNKSDIIEEINKTYINQEFSDQTKLHDISKETWELEITKNSLITLLDDHEPEQNIFMAFLYTCGIILLLIVVRAFSLTFASYNFTMVICSLFSLTVTVILSRGYYHIIKLNLLKSRVNKRETDPLRKRPVTLKIRALICILFIGVFSVTYSLLVLNSSGIYMIIIFAIGVAISIHYSITSLNQYIYILRHAPFLISHIENKYNENSNSFN